MQYNEPRPELCHQDDGPLLVGISCTLLGIGLLTVMLRIYFRLGLRHGLHWDDYLIVGSSLVGIVGFALLVKVFQAGAGKHMFCLPPGSIYPVLKWGLLAQIVNVAGIGLVKMLSRFIWVLIVFVAFSHLAQMMVFFVQCRPLWALWNPKVKGSCLSRQVVYTAGYANYGLDAVTDLICAGIPLCVLHQLQMNRRTKVAIGFLMSLGVITAGCAIAKAITIRSILVGTDYTWDITDPTLLTVTEHYVGITIASMPALKPLFSRILNVSVSNPTGSDRGSSKLRLATASLRNSIRERPNITVTTNIRFGSQVELANQPGHESPNAGAVPEFLRESSENWTHGPGMERAHDASIRTGGYTHISSLPGSSSSSHGKH
ncbi:MAG: hypothetical protein Q9219_001021 [cf. Caloplaca sp. 3 TL-2023]